MRQSTPRRLLALTKAGVGLGCVLTWIATMSAAQAPASRPSVAELSGPIIYRGASDASAAVAINERTIVVADDENNVLRTYDIAGGLPKGQVDLSAFLAADPDHPEADIEGATQIGNRIYWITSHGRNRKGKWREGRHRFFATEIVAGQLRPVGRPYTHLAEQMVTDATVTKRCPALAAALRPHDKKNKAIAPKAHGLNIETLCAARDGRSLYVGLRNPLARTPSGQRAIVLPMTNGRDVIDKNARPAFGPPLLWDLGGMGLRGMEYSPRHKSFFLVAGRTDGTTGWALYRWSGNPAEQPTLVLQRPTGQATLRPETVIAFPDSDKLLLLSDDGSEPVKVAEAADCLQGEYRPDGTRLNKHLRNPARKTFRGAWASVPPINER